MTTYGYTIRWRSLSGNTEVSVSDCVTAREAYEKTVEFAYESGWQPPKWYEFWRWRDTRPRPPEADD